MKDNWSSKNISQLCEVKGGKRLPAGEEFALGQTPFPYLRVTNMVNGSIDDSDLKYVKVEIEPFIRNYKISYKDLYVTIAGTLGAFGSIPKHLDNSQLTENAAKLTNIDFNEIDKNFYKFYLSSNIIKEQIYREIGVGGGVPKLALHRIEKLIINYPPLPQQKKIAKILSTVDKVIEQTEAAIAKYQAIKQGLMHDLFTRGIDVNTGKLRPTPQEAPELYKESALGLIPRDWEVEQFEKTCLKVADRDHFTPTYFDQGIPIISPKDFDDNHNISFEKCKYISLEAHIKNSKKTDLKTDDLVFTRIGAGLGKVTIVESWMPEFSILHSACMIRTDDKILDSRYLMYYMKGELLQRQIGVEVQSIGVPDLGLDKIRLFKCSFPEDKNEQIFISNKLSKVDHKIQTEQQALAKYQQLKAGLLQDLLTGKVEVNV